MDPYLKTKDFAVTGEEFELVYQEELQMLKTTPQPSNMDRYYESEEYISHTDSSSGFFNGLYQWVKSRSMQRKLKLLEQFHKLPGGILDVGAGTGDFVIAAGDKGWESVGVEPNKLARKKAAMKGLQLKAELGDAKRKFDAITLWHVLEHLPNPEQSIDDLLSLLELNGTLVLALPNFKSWDARYYKRHWAAYDVPRHLWHFSQHSIDAIFKPRGYKIEATYPLWFDAYYISLLSEKYKGSKFPWLRAIVNGCRSNLNARQNGEYSSLIYILKRA